MKNNLGYQPAGDPTQVMPFPGMMGDPVQMLMASGMLPPGMPLDEVKRILDAAMRFGGTEMPYPGPTPILDDGTGGGNGTGTGGNGTGTGGNGTGTGGGNGGGTGHLGEEPYTRPGSMSMEEEAAMTIARILRAAGGGGGRVAGFPSGYGSSGLPSVPA